MTTLATNILGKATGQFKNYEFKGFLKAYGKTFGLSETGFYKLEGDSDNGVIRTASLTLSNNDFGMPNEKRFPFFYIQVYADKDFKITFITDDKETSSQYVKIKKPGLQLLRIPCSRVSRGVQWSLRLDVINNGHLRLYSIIGLPTTLHAGRSLT